MDNVDNIGIIQKKLNKAIEKRAKSSTDKLQQQPKKSGLLARKSEAPTKAPSGKSNNKMDVESILIDYITNIRQYKEDILNGSK